MGGWMNEDEGINQRMYMIVNRHRQHCGDDRGYWRRGERWVQMDKGRRNREICNGTNNKSKVKIHFFYVKFF